MIELTKMTIRHAAGLLKARLKDQHGKEAKDLNEAIETVNKMDDERMAESATYDSEGALRDLASLGLSVQV